MDQMSFGDFEYASKRKRTRREKFLAEMDQVIPWSILLNLIEPVYPKAGNGRRPYPLKAMLRIHLMQNWFGLSDPAMEEALYEIGSMRQFAGLSLTRPIPDETTILNFRRLLEKYELAEELLSRVNAYLTRKGLLLKRGTIVDATIIAAPSSTKNAEGERDPEMHQTKKGQQWYFGMKAHIGVDVDSGLVHTVTGTAANVADIEEAEYLLHGNETVVYADAGYTGADKRIERKGLTWQIARKRGSLNAMKEGREKRAIEKAEKRKASVRARGEHPFQILKCRWHYVKTRFKGLAKNTAQITTLFALGNLYRVRKQLMALTGSLRLQAA